jgi:hypothetical protein
MNDRGGGGGEFHVGDAVHVGFTPDAGMVLTE